MSTPLTTSPTAMVVEDLIELLQTKNKFDTLVAGFLQKGGTEAWLQTELSVWMNNKHGTQYNVEREQKTYTNAQTCDLKFTPMKGGNFFAVELKLQTLYGSGNVRDDVAKRVVEEDISKIEKAHLNDIQYISIAVSISGEGYDACCKVLMKEHGYACQQAISNKDKGWMVAVFYKSTEYAGSVL